jgi:ATP-dependent DNA helicase DinG
MVRQETGYSANAILPPFERLIFDEGHHLEDVATGSLSTQSSRQGLLKILGRLQNPRKPQQGLLPALSTRLSSDVPESLDDLYMEIAAILESKLIPGRGVLNGEITQTMDSIAVSLTQYLQKNEKKGGEQKLRLTDSLYGSLFWGEVEEKVRKLAVDLTDYAGDMQALFKACEKLPDKVLEKIAGILTDLKGMKGRLETAAENLYFFISRQEGCCRWFEIIKGAKGVSVRLCSSPLEVAETIKGVILDKFKTIVITSATLAVGDRFSYLEERTGISLVNRSRVTELQLSSPFDYKRQAFVGIPADIPEPTTPGYERTLGVYLLKSLAISEGRAFVLFTSYELLSRVYGRLLQELKNIGLNPMRQGETNRHLLLSRFKKENNAVLFGTDSFWEGVDVQGKALELVVITRLPFRVPTEPVLEARAEHIAAKGLDPFMEYTIPQAVLKFKQGFGRLIRSRDDRGGVLILDSRVLSKNYGRYFLRSLPDAEVVKGDGEEVFAAMGSFFATFSEQRTKGARGKKTRAATGGRGGFALPESGGEPQ